MKGAMTGGEVAAFDRCVAAGGVALFPADTVYGLATGAESKEGFERLYEIKGRDRGKPAAVMFFDRGRALTSLPGLGPRVRAALERLLPGRVTLVVPNPDRRFPLACGPSPDRLGVRVPELAGPLAPMAAIRTPVLQSSANPAGAGDVRRLGEVDSSIRDAVDLELDGGELPGTASTVVDLSGYEDGEGFEILREGALPADAVAARL